MLAWLTFLVADIGWLFVDAVGGPVTELGGGCGYRIGATATVLFSLVWVVRSIR